MLTVATGLLVVSVAAAALGSPPMWTADHVDNHSHDRGPSATTIVVSWRHPRSAVHRQVLGVNLDYFHDGQHVWDARKDRPVSRVVHALHRTDVQLIRYPGGIAANLFDWKKAVGAHRGCQVDGRKQPGGFRAFTTGNSYGPDENEMLARSAGAGVALMVPFVTGSPSDAADWVEYMDSPANTPANPNGGIDWAQRRAVNGHPGPYHVQRWEIGNEQRLPQQRYWMSGDSAVALHQYIHGASPVIADERLGKDCRHPTAGTRSNGASGQVFDVLYPPVASGSADVLVNGHPWAATPNIARSQRGAHVYQLLPRSGQVVFGNHTHGAVPRRGAVVEATYRTVHAGVFTIMRAMHAVDPSIQTCVSWGLKSFVKAAGGHRYDCFSAHAYTHFKRDGHQVWASRLEGHDRHMLGADNQRRVVASLKRDLPAHVRLPLTEFGSLWGDSNRYPSWPASMTRALYMATEWIDWLELDIPWATGGVLGSGNLRGLLGPSPGFTVSAEAVTRTAVAPLFDAGGHRLRAVVRRNPVRDPNLSAGTYRGLKVVATHGRDGAMYLLVVNRLPLRGDAVRTELKLAGFTSRGRATVRRVSGSSFHDWNRPGKKATVHLAHHVLAIGRHRFRVTFPAHSISLLRIPRAS